VVETIAHNTSPSVSASTISTVNTFRCIQVWMYSSLDAFEFGCIRVWMHSSLDAFEFGFIRARLHANENKKTKALFGFVFNEYCYLSHKNTFCPFRDVNIISSKQLRYQYQYQYQYIYIYIYIYIYNNVTNMNVFLPLFVILLYVNQVAAVRRWSVVHFVRSVVLSVGHSLHGG
jgi:hypothetical protein